MQAGGFQMGQAVQGSSPDCLVAPVREAPGMAWPGDHTERQEAPCCQDSTRMRAPASEPQHHELVVPASPALALLPRGFAQRGGPGPRSLQPATEQDTP